MKNLYEDLKCPVCLSHFFEDEDIVFCPVCGLPHHRNCYNTIGHCKFESDHSTDRQWDKLNGANNKSQNTNSAESKDRIGIKCPNCNRMSSSHTLFCPYCGLPLTEQKDGAQNYQGPFTRNPFLGYQNPYNMQGRIIDPLGGVEPTEVIDGIPVVEVSSYVSINTIRYIPKFYKFRKQPNQKRVSWNWPAFFFPAYFMMYRKCYGAGIFALTISLICSLLFAPSLSVYTDLVSSQGVNNSNYNELYNLINNNFSYFQQNNILTYFLIGVFLQFLTSLFFGIFADYIYKSHSISKIKELKKDVVIADYHSTITLKGGVNVFAPLLAMLAYRFVSMIVFSFLTF